MNDQSGILPPSSSEHLLAGQLRVLELIARGAPLEESLTELACLIEAEGSGLTCSLCILNASRTGLEKVIAPGLSQDLIQQILGVPFDSRKCAPCVEVASSAEAVVIEDVRTDAHWSGTPWAQWLKGVGFVQCRSTPIFDSASQVCGTFVLLSREPGQKVMLDRMLNESVAYLASIAIKRERDEVELRDSEERLRLAVDATKMGLWDWDLARKTGVQNSHSLDLFGGARLSLEKWKEIIHPADRKRVVDSIEAALSGRGADHFYKEYRIVRGDGSIRWVSGFGRVLFQERDGSRVPARVIGANLDITETKRNEQEATEHAARFRFLAESLPHKIFTATPEGETDYLNQKWADYTGLPVQDVMRLGWREFVHPDDLSEKQSRWTISIAQGTPFEFEHRFRRRDGEFRWHLTRAEPRRDGDGRILMWIGSNTDVHDLKRAQFDLQEREARFRVMADATPVLIWMSDLTGEITYVNKQWIEFTGGPPSQTTRWGSCIHPADAVRCEIYFTNALEERRSFQMEYRLRRHDGEFRWILDSGKPLQTPDGTFVGFIGGCIEIHEQKAMEIRLREAESRARLALEAAGMGFWDWTIGSAVKWSPEHNRMLGLDPAQTEGTYEQFFQRVHPDDRQLVSEALERSKQTRTDFQAEFRAYGPGGELRWILAHGRAIYEEETGKPLRMLGVVLDITQRKLAEEQIRRNQDALRMALSAAEVAREEAETASRAKDQFLAVLSHELRTPLTPVLMAVSTIKVEPGLSDLTRSALEMIQRNVKVEARLIDDLLDLTRINRNKLEFKKEPIDLEGAVREAIDICRPDLEAKKLRCEFTWDAGTARVHGDFARLQQVFWNLIKNAVKFSVPEGVILIHARDHERMILISIQDFGIGIPPEVLPRIFKPFEQGDTSIVRQFGGLGLGLAISLAIIRAHRGSLYAESPGMGKGATFTVELETFTE